MPRFKAQRVRRNEHLGEPVRNVIQMVRFGFGRIDSKEEPLTVYFAHK
jgi:hypothetical protein